jgi:hypothetical protein
MRDTLIATLAPVVSSLLVALAAWVSVEARRYLARRTYSDHRAALRACAESVVADLAAHEVERAKGGEGWTPSTQADVRASAVRRVKSLEPLAVIGLAPVLGADALDALVGTLVEQAVAAHKRGTARTSGVA